MSLCGMSQSVSKYEVVNRGITCFRLPNIAELIYDQKSETRKGVNIHDPQQDNFIRALCQRKLNDVIKMFNTDVCNILCAVQIFPRLSELLSPKAQ
jgi:hypothetical protein